MSPPHTMHFAHLQNAQCSLWSLSPLHQGAHWGTLLSFGPFCVQVILSRPPWPAANDATAAMASMERRHSMLQCTIRVLIGSGGRVRAHASQT